MNKMNIARLAAAASLAAGFAFATTIPAQAAQGGGKGVSSHGSCSASSTWKLKAKADNSNIEVEAEVDSNVRGQVWTFSLTDNGTQVASGTKRTHGASGSFSVRRLVANQAGSDQIGFQAMNAKSGETCTGTVTL